jgi:hypothetical protein
VAAPLSAILVAGPDLGVSSPLIADAWDPNRRDYASLDDGADAIDAHVVHELCVVRGSGASVRDVGLERLPTKMLDSLEQDVAASVRLALSRLVDAGDIRLKSVRLTHRDDSKQLAEVTITYVNLRTGGDRVTVMPLPSAPVQV